MKKSTPYADIIRAARTPEPTIDGNPETSESASMTSSDPEEIIADSVTTTDNVTTADSVTIADSVTVADSVTTAFPESETPENPDIVDSAPPSPTPQDAVNLTIKVTKNLRRHWLIEARRQDTSLTAAIIEALNARFGAP
ncbi:MAG: hypothetical protein WCP07_09450 [bacterium]